MTAPVILFLEMILKVRRVKSQEQIPNPALPLKRSLHQCRYDFLNEFVLHAMNETAKLHGDAVKFRDGTITFLKMPRTTKPISLEQKVHR
jgi:hypothetical protein